MRVTFLGTGTSHGVPVIGCACAVCRSSDPKDRRTRTGVVVRRRGTAVGIDAPPEFRLQLVRFGIRALDALLLTHAHADHISGLDDLRIFSERQDRDFPVYGPASSLRQIRRRFDYVFRRTQAGGGKPRLRLRALRGSSTCGGMRVVPLPAWHGQIRVFGYRMGGFAYLTDVSRIPEETYRLLRGVRVLVLGALRHEPHPTHFNLEQAVNEARKIGAPRTWLTHVCHRLGHAATNRRLPASIHLAYDGLELRLPD